jgi:hypothetical protein
MNPSLLPMPLSAIERVVELARMPARNNSYGCEKVDPVLAQAAIRLLEDLPETFPDPVILPLPIVPAGCSGLEIDWSGIGVQARVTPGAKGAHVVGVSKDLVVSGIGDVYALAMEAWEGPEAFKARIEKAIAS